MISNVPFPIIAAFIIIAIWSLSCFKVVPQNRRVLLFRLGRQVGYLGPGLIFLLKPLDSGYSIDIGDIAELASSDEAIKNGTAFPVIVEGETQLGKKVVVTRFTATHAVVSLSPNNE